MSEKILNKVLSGRFLLTAICGIVFAYCAMKGRIEVAAITSILSSVFASYFSRDDRAPEQKPPG